MLAIVITAEKLLPRPAVTARLFGIGAIVAGIVMAIRWATQRLKYFAKE